jgi:ABC-type polysaccharide/polyol phosphate export permease
MSSPAIVASEVWRSRDLLRNLISKELKVRYKGSALGILWSLVTPLLMAGIFTVVFLTFLRIPFGDGNFTTFFLAGYLVWQFFANSVNSSAGSIIANGSLIKKVYFPRELIPLSLVFSQGVHLLLALLVTSPLFLYYRGFHPQLLPLIALALVLVTLFTAGMSMLLGALTVKFRDLTELLQVIMMAWFYLTPVIYSIENIRIIENGDFFVKLLRLNPMTWFAELFHTLLYGIPLPPTEEFATVPHPMPGSPDLTTWLFCAGWGLLTFAFGYALFRRQAGTFAKEV